MQFRFSLLLLTGLLLLTPAVGVRPLRAQGGGAGPSSPEVRLEGRVRAVTPGGIELDVYFSTSPSGMRKRFTQPIPRRVRITPASFIYDRSDRTVFLTPQDLKPGMVISLFGSGGDSLDVTADEVWVGGKLPPTPKPLPIPLKPDVPETVAVPPRPKGAAKFEPAHGCYLGAFVMHDENVGGQMDRWESTVGKGHASYLRYVGYGQPFPKEWVQQVRRIGAVPNIAFEPNGGLKQVTDSAYLRGFAHSAAESGGPVFMRFASEMNGTWTAYSGDPKLYRLKFRLVARRMREDAPNVAMVWTPYCSPLRPIPEYYPGDDAVDWVGVNIYSVHHHDGKVDQPADQEDPTALLEPIYTRYASRKPIQISEYAATSFCKACSQQVTQFAIRKMQRMYSSLPTRFPRVKMIYWFSWDTIAGGAADNNYSVTSDPQVLRSYQQLTHTPYFLPRLKENATQSGTAVGPSEVARR